MLTIMREDYPGSKLERITWVLGMPRPLDQEEVHSVKMILASGEELRKIKSIFIPNYGTCLPHGASTVPIDTLSLECYWYGDLAKTVLSNLLINIV